MKNASDRNKIRRRVYSALSEIKKYPPNIHIVFLPKKEIVKIPFETLKRDIESLLLRVNISK